MNKYICFSIALVLNISLNPLRADVELSVDFDPSTPGIQNTVAVAQGDSVAVDIVMQLTGSTSVSAYQFSVEFDTSELLFISRAELFPAGFGFFQTDSSNTNDLLNGRLYRFGGDTGIGPVAPSGPFVVASLTFEANIPMGSVGDIDVRPIILASQGDAFLRNVTYETIPNSEQLLTAGSVSE